MTPVVVVCEGQPPLSLPAGDYLLAVGADGYVLAPADLWPPDTELGQAVDDLLSKPPRLLSSTLVAPRPQGYPQPVDGQRVEINVIEERFGPPETIERERHGRPR